MCTLVLVLDPTSARACSLPTPCPEITHTSPPDGATDVPLNVEIEVAYHIDLPPGHEPVQLRDAITLRDTTTGELVALERSPVWNRMRPVAMLAADRTYEVLGARDYGHLAIECAAGAAEVLATFTTGDTIDDTPPTAPSVSASACSPVVCGNDGCCGPHVAAVVRFTWSSTDDGGLALVYANGAVGGVHTISTSGSVERIVSGTGTALHIVPRVPRASGTGAGLLAIDAAGNVSAPTPLPAADLGCANDLDPDGGVRADASADTDAATSVDAGIDAGADASTARDDSGSCAVSRGRVSLAPIATMLAILALALRRRPRARA
ncbi:hypothetical protein DB32_006509 [Sandaracinus amylolyticus]|uniref:Uncharacterized protein n=1 Tax=Sandaracinus amylolyticus TaxID=927083 RepID=A0A0F6YKN6_9BACT|nr:hypothetical protein DB32_006509 [Sandaracinus amylolyticus]